MSAPTLRPPFPIRMGYRVLQGAMTLDVTHLMLLEADQLAPSARETPDDVCLRLLSQDDVRYLSWDKTNQLDAELATRLISGYDFCVAAMVDGRLASCAWYALDSIEAEHNRGSSLHSGTAVSYPSHMAFLYKGFTHPDFRGRGLYSKVHAYAFETLKSHDVSAILATADWTNQPALKSCYRSGFRYLGHVWRFGFGRHVAGVYPPAAKDYGIRLGSAAQVTQRR